MQVRTLHDICTCEGKLKGDEFVGIRCDGKQDGGLSILFPLGYFASDEELRGLPEEELRECVVNLFDVLSDSQLTGLQNSSIETLDAIEPEKSSFPMQAYLFILRDYMDRGYFCEREVEYQQGANGKINWGRTIKQTQPVLCDGNVMYLNPIARKTNSNEDGLITLVHKFCAHEAASKIGFIFGVEADDENPLDFDAEMFHGALLQKLSRTFNDHDSMLFRNMLSMVEYLEKGLTEDFSTPKDFYFGVNKFDAVWEKMVDSIFGNVANKTEYDPHLKFVANSIAGNSAGDVASNVAGNAADKAKCVDQTLESDGDTGESLRSTLRPDTIMALDGSVFILDSKYYKFGIKNSTQFLPGAESVCKQMAYAEYVENHMGIAPENIFNAFIMPYHAENASLPFGLENRGFIYGDWKNVDGAKADGNRPYHKIACICLDMKSVMRNYRRNEIAQYALANVVKQIAVNPSTKIQAKKYLP